MDYTRKIEHHWKEIVSQDDLVLIAGDISWAKTKEEVKTDLAFIDALPGQKIISKGNHDYWWPSDKQLKELLPKSIIALNKNATKIGPVSIGATRLYDAPGTTFSDHIAYQVNPRENLKEASREEDADKIYERELLRLELALSLMPEGALRIAMVHYPPLGADLKPSRASLILEKYRIDICVFGHLHNIKKGVSLFGSSLNGVAYHLTSSDYLDFKPLLLKEI